MEEIKTMFTIDKVIMIGINRGAYQAIVSYLDVPSIPKTVFLYNPYLNTRPNNQISVGYKNQLMKILKTEKTHFYIGVNKSKKIERRTIKIVNMKENETTVYSKLYNTMDEMLQENLMNLKEYDDENVTAINYLMNEISTIKYSLHTWEREVFETLEKVSSNKNDPEIK